MDVIKCADWIIDLGPDEVLEAHGIDQQGNTIHFHDDVVVGGEHRHVDLATQRTELLDGSDDMVEVDRFFRKMNWATGVEEEASKLNAQARAACSSASPARGDRPSSQRGEARVAASSAWT